MPDDRHNAAREANLAAYAATSGAAYRDVAPHLRHPALRALQRSLSDRVLGAARLLDPSPRVLDLGGGEGTHALAWLEAGARVTVVDLSPEQLGALGSRCVAHAARLRTLCLDVIEAIARLAREGETFEVVSANSFLHHVPDYVALVREACGRVAPGGSLLTFQDPLRYDGLGLFARGFSAFAYGSWRVFQGDVFGGARRRLRRMRGVHLDGCPQDNAEYHVTRGGVDAEAIVAALRERGFEAEVVRYFSTHGAFWQRVGSGLGLENTFAVVATAKGGECRGRDSNPHG